MDELARTHPEAHPVGLAWDAAIARVRQTMAQRGVHPAQTVVLLPFAQLIAVARAAWLRSVRQDCGAAGAAATFFLPRFETAHSWAATQGGFFPSGDDLRMDAARDALTAASLLARGGLVGQAAMLAGRLMEAAWSLARPAAAVAPALRARWGEGLAQDLGAHAPALELEARIGRTALAWAAHSAYRSDCLFGASAALLVLVEGLQPEPLREALRAHWGERAMLIQLAAQPAHAAQLQAMYSGAVALHAARDPEDEAQRAAACVLVHLAQARSPVALVAQDRLLSRRVRALLGERGIALRDETGWTLSTTRAAASVMGLLRAAAWDAQTDAVIDWAKNAPAIDAAALAGLEAALRRSGGRDWRAQQSDDPVALWINALRSPLQTARRLGDWLAALRSALEQAGQWQALQDDSAGGCVLDALRLREGPDAEFSDQTQRIGQSAFVAWVSQTLEAGSFIPPDQGNAQVLILPIHQLLGRAFAAVVLPGCDELHLSASPEVGAMWTPAQREALGLPAREALAVAARAAWGCALGSPRIDLLWRESEGGERLMPSPFVQRLLIDAAPLAGDPRLRRTLQATPVAMPQPAAPELPVQRLSASAYEDLRSCPYRFFALRQLGLQPSDEIDSVLDKRDFGNWLHLLLGHFHQALAAEPVAQGDRAAALDRAADRATQELGLARSEFIPFAASWPHVRGAYLQWLSAHEAGGARFAQAEAKREMPLGRLLLHGRIDRIDRLPDGSAIVIDYKTEPRSKSAARIKGGTEDTQLAFYAALLEDDTLGAAYLNISESEPVRKYPQDDIVALRDGLLQSIQHDMQRVGEGAVLPALGAGQACDYCAARGLCRRDFWAGGGYAGDAKRNG